MDQQSSRRALIAGAGAAGAGMVLAACGGEENPSANPAPTSRRPRPTRDPNAPIAKTTDIPVGSGKVLVDEEMLITQPKAGEFLGFTNYCTHEACVLTNIQGDTIICGCHGSRFGMNGAVKEGPARSPLQKVALKIEGDEIKRG